MSKIKDYWMDAGEPEQWQFDEARQAAREDFEKLGFWDDSRVFDSVEVQKAYRLSVGDLMQKAQKADED